MSSSCATKSELLSLTWKEVDFRPRRITVQAADAKNGTSRSVPMNAVLTATLQASRIDASAEGLVFRSRAGTPSRSFRLAFERAVQKAGLDDCTFHGLWHTFASRLVMAGADLPTVKELLGHKNISMTLRYSHLSSDHKQRAVRLLEQCGTTAQQFSQHSTGLALKRSHKSLKKMHRPLSSGG